MRGLIVAYVGSRLARESGRLVRYLVAVNHRKSSFGLRDAELTQACLEEAVLVSANSEGATAFRAILARAKPHHGTVMPRAWGGIVASKPEARVVAETYLGLPMILRAAVRLGR